MNLGATLTRTGVSRALGVHALVVVLAVAVGLAAALAAPVLSPTALAVGAGVVLAVLLLASSWGMRRILRSTEVVERLLARFAEGAEDPNAFPELAVASPAAAGWNRLARLARRWTAVHELEQSVAAGLSNPEAGSLGSLIDSLADGVAATDAAGQLLQVNSAFAATCRAATCDELLGRPFGEVFTLPEPRAALVAETPAQKRLSFEFTTAGGFHARTLRVTRSPRYGDGERLDGHVWLVRDVTQHRLAEDMRDKFLETATHELRTPLANISAYAESLATVEDIDPESQKRFYNVIQSEAVRLSQLIDDLLDVSRMQAGALAIDRRETDLARLIDEVAQKVEGTMHAKQIDFHCELPPKMPKIAADKSKLAAALVNLLGNAAKYTPDGGRVTFRVDVGESKIEFAVTDTGIGIAPEELPRVFDRFFRSDDQRVKDIPGSGLGLSLTQEIARLHGGDLTVDSELHVGSTFRITFPIEGAE
ncbi:Sensor histidine kinase YycG [Pirellulimonas nuda]|uniref:histidine kinase n=1 Tax=Pirellulimonas nuda TaxID=2528009 RepID=A0A518DFY5_9BACT|nr:ATP-binding protein [Pirellulimonas nuda]QDU90384.1 Sensor histidine kinase YycG [Pirellulimonas nuda]